MPEKNTIVSGAGVQIPAPLCALRGCDLLYEFLNPAFQDLFRGEVLIGNSIFESFPGLPDSIYNDLQNNREAVQTLTIFEVPLEASHPVNGVSSTRYFNFMFSVRNDEAVEDGVIAVAFETTSATLAAKAAIEHEQRFRTMVEASPVAMMVLKGASMQVETANASMCLLIGKTELPVGMPIALAIPGILTAEFTESMSHTFTTGQMRQVREEPMLIRQHGIKKIGYFDISCQALYDDDKITGILVTALNITEQVNSLKKLKQSEENFRLLADNISQLAWMADEMGYVFWYNERWYEYTASSYNQMKLLGWQSVYHPEHVQRVAKNFERALKTGEIWEDTFPIRNEEGEYRWFLSRAVPLKDSNGRVQRWFGTNTDITDQRRLIEQKQDFISIASHELKTPLTSIKGYIQLLQLPESERQNELNSFALAKADQQVNKMINLIKGLLDMSRFEDGMLHFNPVLFDMVELIQEVIEDAGFIKNSHHVKFDKGKQVMLTADRSKIAQVITNLLTNAAKYSPVGTTINVSCSKNSDDVTVNVHDHGVGIEEEHQQKIFERFYRVNSISTSTISGFGIGLFVCAQIIKLHHGKIGLQSIPAKGTNFYFSLPVV